MGAIARKNFCGSVPEGGGVEQNSACVGTRQLCRGDRRADSGANWDLPPCGLLANFGARRFPKGERKALLCARRRIPLAHG